jgi:hypothetical protein
MICCDRSDGAVSLRLSSVTRCRFLIAIASSCHGVAPALHVEDDTEIAEMANMPAI